VEVAAAIRRTAQEPRKGSSWFGPLNSSLRSIVSAMLVQSGDDPAEFLAEMERVHEVFRARELRRGGAYEVMAILILRRDSGGEPIGDAAIGRFQAIYEALKKHHWWLTGREDFPACALLARHSGAPEELAAGVERFFQALQGDGFSAGDPLQTSASIPSGRAPPAATTPPTARSTGSSTAWPSPATTCPRPPSSACGMIAFYGYDGFLYSIGYLAGWIVALFVVAEPLKRLGRFTFADALDSRFGSRGIKLTAAVSTLVVSMNPLLVLSSFLSLAPTVFSAS
jgi:hypothetical protein